MKRRRLLPIALLLLFVVPACSPSEDDRPLEAKAGLHDARLDHLHAEGRLFVMGHDDGVDKRFVDGRLRLERDEPFEQVGFMYAIDGAGELEYRLTHTDGRTTEWAPVEVSWQEDALRNGRILLDDEAMGLELRGPSGLSELQIEFFDEVVARRTNLVNPKPPQNLEVADDTMATRGQAIAPRSLVIPRSAWGAAPPNCNGSWHDPYRMAIHHTYSPADDGGDAAARMRQMQSYHMNNRGWCDIGYHFVASQAGNLYQGRDNEERTAAHVGGQNTGNIGICFIGNFQPGYSTTMHPPQAQLEAGARMIAWVGQTYSIALNRTNIKGHREHSGQTTSCPGDNLLNKIDDMIDMAKNGGGSPASWDVEMKVNHLGLDNFYNQGNSTGHGDALPGNTFQAEILVHNKSSDPIRNVWVNYLIEQPFIEATNYVIQTDHPAYDQASWQVNDADSAAENPAKDAMGNTGSLNLYAFSPNETKRILIDLKATRYSVGAIDHPDVRGWLKHIDDVYGESNSWAEAPSTNHIGHRVRAYSQMDVLDRNDWQFNDSQGGDQNLEGWTAKPADHHDQLKINGTQSLAVHVTGGDARLISPEWTSVNAATFDQMVIALRSHDGPATAAVFWARDGESFSADRVVRFETPGDGDYHRFIVPLSEHADWSGTVTRLRIDPLDQAAPAADDNGWYDVDYVYFQSSAEQRTSSTAATEYLAEAPVTLLGDGGGNPGGDTGGTGGTGDTGGGNPGGDTGGDTGIGADAGTGADTGATGGQPSMSSVNSGCSQTGSDRPLGLGGLALLALGVVGLRRRRA